MCTFQHKLYWEFARSFIFPHTLLPNLTPLPSSVPSEHLSTLCCTMRRQIISRAFQGWLCHRRHMRTVRQHLSGLAFHEEAIHEVEEEWREGVTQKWWQEKRSKLMQDENRERSNWRAVTG